MIERGNKLIRLLLAQSNFGRGEKFVVYGIASKKPRHRSLKEKRYNVDTLNSELYPPSVDVTRYPRQNRKTSMID